MLQSLRGQVLPPREGAGPLPAFLLDLGASYLSSNYPLPFPGREQGDATKFDSMNLINTVRVKEINDERRTMRSNPGTPTLNTMERPLSTDTKSTTALHDPPVPVRAKLAAAWTSFMFLYIYVDYFALYKPGVVDDILDGVVFEFDISQTLLTLFLTSIAIPIFMILLSTTLPTRINRAANLVVASLSIPFAMFNAVGESWTYFYGLSIGLEVLLLALILRYAWTWPRTAPSATMATKTTTTTSIS